VGVTATLLIFAAASSMARTRVLLQMALVAPEEKITSVTLSPAPGNPLCWRTIVTSTASTETGSEYRARVGATSLAPGISSPERCHSGTEGNPTVHLLTPTISGARDVHWGGEYRASVEMFKKLYLENCQLSALMQFLRVPFVSRRGTELIGGDIRYDRELGIGFSEADLKAEPCPRNLPGWIPPASWLIE
jgi:hypothetical protein